MVKRLEAQQQPVHFTTIGEIGAAFLTSMTYTKEQRENIEVAAREQSSSSRWYEERQYRLTASKFGRTVKRQRQSTSLLCS